MSKAESLTHIAFVDFEKAFVCQNRNITWKVMHDKGYYNLIIKVIKTVCNSISILYKI